MIFYKILNFRTVGSYEKPTFSDEEKKKFSDFNRLDEDLYQMSNQTFWEKATERPGGISQLNKDVQNLKVGFDGLSGWSNDGPELIWSNEDD